MKYSIVAFALAAASGAAVAQDSVAPEQASPWEFFEEDGGRNGATVKAPDGSQLVLKCDKPGRREVHAIVLTAGDRLVPPNNFPVSRGIAIQFDSDSPKTENWGFFERYAIAQGKTSDRALAHFVTALKDASQVRMRLDAAIGADVEMEFNVTGAGDAIAQVYQRCGDTVPT
jgi:hypothetical protein